jgi:hypothetical protein
MGHRAFVVGVVVSFALLAARSAQAEPLNTAALEALTKVCMPASEGAKAPRDLALANGYRRDEHAPAGLERVFPLAALSASFTAQSDAGEVHVVSTVMPPPATPYSCAVTVRGEAANLPTDLDASLTKAGYRRNEPKTSAVARMLDYQRNVGDSIDRVLGLFNLQPQPGDWTAILVAYRVGG